MNLENLTDLQLKSNFGSHFDLNYYNEEDHINAAKVIGNRRGLDTGYVTKIPDFKELIGAKKNMESLSPTKLIKKDLGDNKNLDILNM